MSDIERSEGVEEDEDLPIVTFYEDVGMTLGDWNKNLPSMKRLNLLDSPAVGELLGSKSRERFVLEKEIVYGVFYQSLDEKQSDLIHRAIGIAKEKAELIFSFLEFMNGLFPYHFTRIGNVRVPSKFTDALSFLLSCDDDMVEASIRLYEAEKKSMYI